MAYTRSNLISRRGYSGFGDFWDDLTGAAGAVVTGFDVRPVVREQIESLGANWLDLGIVGEEDEGGYGQELTEEQQRRQDR